MLEPQRTRLVFAENASRAAGRDVWVKLDGETHETYGGNKVRKLAPIFAEALRAGATDVITMGAAGSHHVLATGVHGKALGFTVHGALVPQASTEHARRTLLATVAQGVQTMPVRSGAGLASAVAARAAWVRARGGVPYVIPVGASTPTGATGYAAAVDELFAQVRAREIPGVPQAIYAPLGSGGTVAGLVVGAARNGLAPGVVRGVAVVESAERWGAALVYGLARGAERVSKRPRGRDLARADACVVRGWVGAGYGHPSDAGERARELFARDGVQLDPVYSAKTAAALIAGARFVPGNGPVLLVATLSSAPLEPLQAGRVALPEALEALFA